ncbi:unnamed protein product [Rhizoctonia solani]|uniref:Uncharacterized protein n=1 Tax=Rhizoctonia solani TaxID=456999 RepID=A0A8H3BNM1_9AGAM|nr:unnamed protein product [Rhizoctonia solani]
MCEQLGEQFSLAPFEIAPKLSCNGIGLIWCGVRRAQWELIVEHVNLTPSPSPKDKAPGSRKWWQAQCHFLRLPSPGSLTISAAKDQIRTLIDKSQNFDPELLQMEQYAAQQFRDAASEILAFIASRQERANLSKKERAQHVENLVADSSATNQSISFLNSPVAVQQTLLSPPPHPVVPVCNNNNEFTKGRATIEASSPIAMPGVRNAEHMHGGMSGGLNTATSRGQNAYAKFESFALQLLSSTRETHIRRMEQLILQVRGLAIAFAPVQPSPPAADDICMECLRYSQLCMRSDSLSDQANYSQLLAYTELAMWMCRASKQLSRNMTVKEAYDLLGPTVITWSQFQLWHASGYTVLRLICASSIYILPAISVSSMQSSVDHIVKEDRMQIENVLQKPEKTQYTSDSSQQNPPNPRGSPEKILGFLMFGHSLPGSYPRDAPAVHGAKQKRVVRIAVKL